MEPRRGAPPAAVLVTSEEAAAGLGLKPRARVHSFAVVGEATERKDLVVADPHFAKVPVEWLISKDYAAERAKLIRPDRLLTPVYPGQAPSRGDTTYFSCADKDGMMVSLIQSNYADLGSGLVADGLGFMFHDRGALYSLDEKSPNVYGPNKRPFHTIIPGFVMKDGAPWLSFGLMGGDMQPQGHVQVLVNLIDFGMNPQEAGDFMRFRHYGGTEPTGYPGHGTGGRVEDPRHDRRPARPGAWSAGTGLRGGARCDECRRDGCEHGLHELPVRTLDGHGAHPERHDPQRDRDRRRAHHAVHGLE